MESGEKVKDNDIFTPYEPTGEEAFLRQLWRWKLEEYCGKTYIYDYFREYAKHLSINNIEELAIHFAIWFNNTQWPLIKVFFSGNDEAYTIASAHDRCNPNDFIDYEKIKSRLAGYKLRFIQFLTDNGYTDIKEITGDRYAMINRLLFTEAIITVPALDYDTISNRWCYHNYRDAKAALDAWDGSNEPTGWHRHPMRGRRRHKNGNETIQF